MQNSEYREMADACEREYSRRCAERDERGRNERQVFDIFQSLEGK